MLRRYDCMKFFSVHICELQGHAELIFCFCGRARACFEHSASDLFTSKWAREVFLCLLKISHFQQIFSHFCLILPLYNFFFIIQLYPSVWFWNVWVQFPTWTITKNKKFSWLYYLKFTHPYLIFNKKARAHGHLTTVH